MSEKRKKERPSFIIMVYMWLFVVIALVNVVGIASQNIYQSFFPFFIVSLMNGVLAIFLIMHSLKTSDKRERRLTFIYLIAVALIAAVSFFRYLSFQY